MPDLTNAAEERDRAAGASASPTPQHGDDPLSDEDVRELAYRLSEPLKSATLRR